MRKYYTLALLFGASLFLSGCSKYDEKDPSVTEITTASFEQMIAEKFSTEEQANVREGLEALDTGNLKLASQKINLAVLDQPNSSFLHFINGLIYHLMARKGDISKFDLAKAGFEQAIKFNPSNAEAHLQLARVKMDEKRYPEAQNDYAAVLLLKPDHEDALYELSQASYYASDLRTAQMGISRAVNKNPSRADIQRAAVMIYAAAGRSDRSKEHYQKFKALVTEKSMADQTLERAQNWDTLYQKGIVLAQAEGGADTQETDAAQPDFEAPEPEGGSAPAAAPAAHAKDPGAKKTGEGTMIVVDATTMRISEVGTTSKGNNILDKFSATLSPGTHLFLRGNAAQGGGSVLVGGPTINANNQTGIGYTALAGNAGSVGSTRLFAQGITFGAIQYSLNIANAYRQYIEIIGRPSLVASIGSPESAKFFSGQQLTLGLAPQAGGSAGSIQRLPVGVTLEVNPLSLDNGEVVLDITIYGSAINLNDLKNPDGSNVNPTSTFTPILLSKIRTRVKVKLGETVMLGGITERIETQDKSGFPGLQDVPLLQYFFSKETTSSEHKSVVYLLTPRTYESNKHAIKSIGHRINQPNLKELELRNVDWYDPDYNMAISFKHLMPIYREFRHGDLSALQWDMKKNYEEQVTQASSFLYY